MGKRKRVRVFTADDRPTIVDLKRRGVRIAGVNDHLLEKFLAGERESLLRIQRQIAAALRAEPADLWPPRS